MIYHNVERTIQALSHSMEEDTNCQIWIFQPDGTTYYKDSLDDILNCSSSFKRDLKCNALQNIMMHCIGAKYFNPKIGLQTWLLKRVPVLDQAFSLEEEKITINLAFMQ